MSDLIRRLEEALAELSMFQCLPTCSKSMKIIQSALDRANQIVTGDSLDDTDGNPS